MKLLIDECLPRGLKRLFDEHECRTVQEMGGRAGWRRPSGPAIFVLITP